MVTSRGKYARRSACAVGLYLWGLVNIGVILKTDAVLLEWVVLGTLVLAAGGGLMPHIWRQVRLLRGTEGQLRRVLAQIDVLLGLLPEGIRLACATAEHEERLGGLKGKYDVLQSDFAKRSSAVGSGGQGQDVGEFSTRVEELWSQAVVLTEDVRVAVEERADSLGKSTHLYESSLASNQSG